MTMRVSEQEASQRGPTRGNIKPTYGYYRQPNGWITVSPATDMEELKYRKEGWEPLTQYGRFEMATEWAADHPLETLFMFGGAHELCEDQIRQMGLYMHPPLVPTCRDPLNQYHKRHGATCWVGAKPVEFPQLAHMTGLGPFVCRFCGAEKPTTQARDQHEGVAHKEEKGQIRAGEALASALRGNTGAQPSAQAEPALRGALQKIGLTAKQREALTALGVDLNAE